MNTPTPIPTQLPGGIDGTGVYHTPKAAIDAVLANPPLSDAPGGARPVATESKPWSPCAIASVPEIGLEFKSVHTKTYHKYFCYWHNAENSDEHVYEVTLSQLEGYWRASLSNDGNTVCELLSRSKSNALELALAAMRRYLLRGHRAAWRTYRKAAKAAAVPNVPTVPTVPAAPHPAPLTPDEELADTIKRQKEVS